MKTNEARQFGTAGDLVAGDLVGVPAAGSSGFSK
jgi:hypothetical protein